MIDRVFLIDKEAGPTSHDIVDRLRRVLGVRRVGHAGTLDPFATGLLVCLGGRATRLASYLSDSDKRYVGKVRLGIATDTLDPTGRVTRRAAVPADWQLGLTDVLERFRGEVEQVPPMTSAVRVGGRRLHSLARQGIEIERAPRRVTIHGLDVLEMGESHLVLDVRCSKGTYVRTLAADLGQALGTVAHLEELRRTHVGILSVDGAFPAAELAGTTVDELVERASLSAAAALGAWPAVKLGAEDDARVRHGMLPVQSPSSDRKAGERVRLLSETAGLLALAEVVTIPDHAAPSWRLLRVLEAPDPVEP